ncbi:MAG: sigma-70 family RNA polymerase sigma factor [Anaerolineae bacterium]
MGDEKRLLERAREYDPVALGQIYDQYSVKIYNYIYYRLGDARLAEDLTADVFLKMLEAVKASAAWKISLSGWLYRIAHNLVIDYFRRQPRREALPLDERLIAAQNSPAIGLESVLAQQRLRAAISRLTEDQQQVIILKFVEDMSNAEVAEILGKSEGAVKALQHRALAALRRIMGEGGAT